MQTKTQFVRELKDKDTVAAPFLVKFSAVAMGKNGKPYMNLVFGDKTGEIDGRLWEEVPRYAGHAIKDAYVLVQGRCQDYQGRLQVVIKDLQVLREDEVDVKDFVRDLGLNAAELLKTLRDLIASMQDPHYRALAESVFVEDADVETRLAVAPAAKSIHHAYKTGLLEHLVSVCRILDHLSTHYGEKVNRDLLIIGGLFHDIAKLWEMSYERTTDYTSEGRLVGHLVMGVELIEKKIRLLDVIPDRLPTPFPEEKKLLAKHMVVAHHGELEYGSPKEPHCLEAQIVHMVDNLDSKVNSILSFIEQDQTPGSWTGLSRQYGRFFFKPEWARKPQA